MNDCACDPCPVNVMFVAVLRQPGRDESGSWRDRATVASDKRGAVASWGVLGTQLDGNIAFRRAVAG